MRAKNNSVKQKFIAVLITIVIIATAFSFYSFAPFSTANADEIDGQSSYTKTSVDISNGEFTDASGDKPMEPSNWTAAALGDSKGTPVAGVVDLAPDAFNEANSNNLETYKLDIYEEYKDGTVPGTPFGKQSSAGFGETDANALMINSYNQTLAYGYTSSSISLSANSYYKISAWIKTGDFGSGNGASIKIGGLKNPLIFRDINTAAYWESQGYDSWKEVNSSEKCNYGWVEYSFYIETSTMIDSSVTISLQLGDAYDYENKNGNANSQKYEADGYAFFDHVTAHQYSNNIFDDEISGLDNEENFDDPDTEDRHYYLNDKGNSLFYSESDAEYLCIGNDGELVGSKNANFAASELGSFNNGKSGWEAAENTQGGISTTNIFNAIDKSIGIENAVPFSPNGNGDTIFVLSSYNAQNSSSNKFESKSIGFRTEKMFTVERFKNYRLGVWVKTENGAVAGAAVSGYNYKGPSIDPDTEGDPQLRVESELTEGDAENAARNGWKEIAFYIKGSSFADYQIRLELWLGKQSEKAAGVAMFDNIRIEQITSKEFTDYSGSGTSVTFDAEAASNSITNGGFDSIEVYDDYAEPFTPTGWTLMAAGEDGTTGMSTKVWDANYRNYFVSGVVSSNATEYTYKKPNGNTFGGQIVTHKKDMSNSSVPSNLLMMKCDESTYIDGDMLDKGGIAAGYKSSSFSISSNTVQRVDITLCADNISGYGANLVLKSGMNVISTIEKIKDTGNKYETYTFYVNTGESDISEVYVEIWLGLYDDKTNESKLSTGTLFVEDVTLTNMAASSGDDESANNAALDTARSTFTAMVAEYQTKYDADAYLDFAVYSSQKEDFTAFDRYSDSFLKKSYNWTTNSVNSYSGSDAVAYGIFDSQSIAVGGDSGDNGSGVYVPAGYKHANADNRHSLLIKNTSPAASRIKSSTSYTLASGSYYTITIKAKVDIPTAQKAERPNYKGAYIGIADSEHYIEDIKDTSEVSGIFNNDDDTADAYKVFTFYVRTSGEAASADDEDSSSSSDTADTILSLEFGIGGNGSRDEWAVGTLMVNSIEVQQVSNLDYEEMEAALAKSGALQKKYNAIANYASEDEEPEEEEPGTDNLTGDNWYVYMTVILAVVIIIALIAVLVRYYGIKRKRESSGDPSAPSYDREKTLVRQHNKRAEAEEAISDTLDTYEMFDETEEERLEEEQLALLESEELAKLEKQTDESDAEEQEETDKVEGSEAGSAEAQPEESDTPAVEAPAAETEKPEAQPEAVSEDEEDEGYTYSDDIVDFTPSEEKKKELEAKKAEAERIKAEKEAAKKKAEEERAKAEAERKAASRRYNNWDNFDD